MLEVRKRGNDEGGCPHPLRWAVVKSARRATRIPRVGDPSSSPSVIHARDRAPRELPTALRLPSPKGVTL